MDWKKTSLERAFDLASSGRINRVEDIRIQLKAEGYDETQIEGRMLKAQLRELIRKAMTDVRRT